MLETEEIIDNLIADKEYDKRLIPYIKAFFSYNAKQFEWDEETIQDKITLLNQRIKGIEFVELKDRLAFIDFDFGDILINENILGKQLSSKGSKQVTSKVFEMLEIATKSMHDEFGRYYENNSLYPIEALKYSINQQDKESIVQFISNAFNIRPEEIYNINTVWEDKQEDIDYSNKAEKDFLQDSQSTMLPGVANAIFSIMNAKTDKERANGYLNLYAISLLALHYRLDNEKEDKGMIKGQYQSLQILFLEKVKQYGMTEKNPKKQVIDQEINWTIDIEKLTHSLETQLQEVQAQDVLIHKVDNFNEDNSTRSIPTRFEGQALEDAYLEQQVSQILPNYEEKFRPIIQEYFKRSAKVYGWSKEEFDKKIKNYQNSVHKINFKKGIQSESGDTLAYWQGDHIDIKDDLAFVSTKTLLSTFFHEQEHATDDTVRNGKKLERGLPQRFVNLNEYATEIGAVHLTGDKIYTDPLCFTHKMDGYEEFKYAGSMMAAALGISEFEFVKLRDKGEHTFDKTLQERFSYIDINAVMKEFNEILTKIRNAPSILNKRALSEAYAEIYNLADRIIFPRVEHESDDIIPNDIRWFGIKTKYEKTKIAMNMKLAKKQLGLKSRYIKPIIEDDTLLRRYSRVKKEDRKKFIDLVENLYPEKNVSFDNRQILRHVDGNFKHPIKGKIVNLFRRNKRLRLQEPVEQSLINASLNERKEFHEGLQERVGTSTLGVGKETLEPMKKTEKTKEE